MILLAGALGVETLPLLRRLGSPRPRTARLVTGTLGGREVGVLTLGIGPEKAAARAREALRACAPWAVLSIGTCGALTADIAVGDVVTAGPLLLEDEPAGDALPFPGARLVALATVAEPVWTQARRESLARRGAQVCEMEAVAVRDAAPGLPFGALKVVSDAAGASADDPIGPPGEPDPARTARLKARALVLVETRLAPLLESWIGEW